MATSTESRDSTKSVNVSSPLPKAGLKRVGGCAGGHGSMARRRNVSGFCQIVEPFTCRQSQEIQVNVPSVTVSTCHCFYWLPRSRATATRDLTRLAGVAFPPTEKGRHPDADFRSLMILPATPPSALRYNPSRDHRQDSRPEWSRFSFSVGLFSVPVYPGALCHYRRLFHDRDDQNIRLHLTFTQVHRNVSRDLHLISSLFADVE